MAPQMVLLPPPTDVARSWARRLPEAVPGLDVVVAEDWADAARLLPDAQAAYGTLDVPLLSRSQQLEWLQAPSAAPQASYYFPELIAHPVRVTDFRGIISDHVATHALALVLALGRGVHRYAVRQHTGEWVRETDPNGVLDLPTTVAAVIGVGGIGAEITRMLAAFGADVIGVDARRRTPPAGMRALYGTDDLDVVLGEARLVVITLPQTPATVGLFDARRIAAMPYGSYLVNVGRGPTVDLDAVVAGLTSGTSPASGWTSPSRSRCRLVTRCGADRMRCSPRTLPASARISTSASSPSWWTTPVGSSAVSRCSTRSTRRKGIDTSRGVPSHKERSFLSNERHSSSAVATSRVAAAAG